MLALSRILRGVILLIAWVVLLGRLAQSGEILPNSSLPLSLEQAVTLALLHNQDFRIAATQKEGAEITVRQRRDQFLPEITGSAGLHGRHNQGDSGSQRNYHQLTTDLSARLNLFNGFGDRAALAAARFNLLAQDHALDRAGQQVIFDTVSAYLTAVQAREQIRVAEANLEDNRTLLEQIQAFHRAGRRPVTDVYRQQAETAKAEADLLSLKRSDEISRLTLLRILGVPATVSIEVAMPQHPLLVTEPDTNRATMLAAALANRPDLLAQQRDLAAAGEQIRVARSAAYPSLDLVAGVGSGYDSRNRTGFGSQYDHDNLYGSAGLTLSVPIFDRNLARHQVSQARIGEQASRLVLERLLRQVEVEIGRALADYQNARDQVTVAAAQAAYGREALHSTEQRYRVGAATLTDLTDARSTLVSARYAEIAAHMVQMRQTIAIAYHRGELDAGPFLKELSE